MIRSLKFTGAGWPVSKARDPARGLVQHPKAGRRADVLLVLQGARDAPVYGRVDHLWRLCDATCNGAETPRPWTCAASCTRSPTVRARQGTASRRDPRRPAGRPKTPSSLPDPTHMALGKYLRFQARIWSHMTACRALNPCDNSITSDQNWPKQMFFRNV